MDADKLVGNWNTGISEFTFNGMVHREAYHVHDSAMNHYVFGDTEMVFAYRYFLPKAITFKIKGGQMVYNQDISMKDFASTATEIKRGKNILLCDSIFFSDGNYGSGLCSYGYAKLEGKFKDENTFEGNIIIENVYQRLTDHTILNYLPIYSYNINQRIPVKLVKQ